MIARAFGPLLGRYAAILVAVLSLFVFEPILTTRYTDSWSLSLATFFLLLGSLRALWTSRLLLRAITVLGLVFLGFGAWEASSDSWLLPIWTDVFGIAFLGATAFGILADIFTREDTTADTVFGASAVYLLIGLLFARVFLLLAHLDPDAFALSEPLAQQLSGGGLRRSGILQYFSLITLTTIGYGDVTPVSPLARNLAAVEGVVAQLYIAAVIARMVAQYTASRTAR